MYIAYFEIDEDGDFHFEKYKGLNHDYVLFSDRDAARYAICAHIRLAIDTVGKHSMTTEEILENLWIKNLKQWLCDAYSDVLNWDFGRCPELYVERDFGNASLTYLIKEVKNFDELE